MVRGCKKSIIYLKNTGSNIFKEAYFIVDEGKGISVLSEGDMVCEAKRIIDERSLLGSRDDRKRSIKSRIKRYALPFLAGALTAGVPLLLVVLL